jgi:hypothetical protein
VGLITPGDYLVQEAQVALNTAQSNSLSIAQGKSGTITLKGTALAGTTSAMYSAVPVSTTPAALNPATQSPVQLSVTSISATQSDGSQNVTLGVTVDPNAPAGSWQVTLAGSPTQPQPPTITVLWRNRADSCGTTVLSQQGLARTQTVTVYGHGLMGAVVTLSTADGSPMPTQGPLATPVVGTVTSAADPTQTSLSIAVPIAKSTYVPGGVITVKPDGGSPGRPAISHSQPMTLTVNPAGGTPSSFSLSLEWFT